MARDEHGRTDGRPWWRTPGRTVARGALVLAAMIGLGACATPASEPLSADASPDPVRESAARAATPAHTPDETTVDASMIPDAVVEGLEGGCAMLEAQDPRLHAAVLEGIDPDVDHGPLVVVLGESDPVVATTLYPEPGVQGDAAAWRWDGTRVLALNDTAVRISSHTAATIDTAGEDTAAMALALAHDCSWVVADRAASDPPQPEPTMATDLMVVEGGGASPGDEVALLFPAETFRGIAFQLDRAIDDGWETTHLMTSDANGTEYMTTAAVGDDFAVIDVGIGGPGPDHVRLPEDVSPGPHRICTANAGDEFCAPLEIVE